MELLIDREKGIKSKNSTISPFYVNGAKEYVCLEPTDRGLTSDMSLAEILARKIPGKTALPTGRYEMDWYYSPKHGKYVPRILGTRGFAEGELHVGNDPKDTEACPLLAMEIGGPDFVSESQKACNAFYPVFEETIKKEKVFINIK